MKALSIKQPWVELILEKKKTIEIRTWNTKFRGYFLIHSSRNVDKKMLGYYFNLKNLLQGYFLGYAELIDVITYNSNTEFFKDKEKHLSISKPKKYPVYGFVLENVYRIRPLKYRGGLGFFEVPEIKELGDLK